MSNGVSANNNKFLISVIIPVYNLEDYLREAVESVISQTIGFENNIQLILVNDGSRDDSEKICLEYKTLYPENIVYIKKANGGVSSARNEGMKHIDGKYVNFLDGDDKWAEDAFEKAINFFEKNDVDVVSCRQCYFEKRTGFTRALDYKYAKDAVIDIYKDFSFIQMSVSSVIIKADALFGMEFDTRLKISEDSIFAAKVILKKKKYGVLNSAVYYYRKRLSDNSTIDTIVNNKSWYLDTPIYSYKALFEYSNTRFGEVLPYCQFQVMYDLQWRLRKGISEELTAEERSRYIGHVIDLLKCIEDRIIIAQRNLNFAYKMYALSLKYGKNVFDSVATRKGHIFRIDNTRILNLHAKNRLLISKCEINNDLLTIEGTTHLGILGDKYTLGFVKKNNEFLSCSIYPSEKNDIFAFTGEKIFTGTKFKAEIKLTRGDSIRFALYDSKNNEHVVLKPYFTPEVSFTNEVKNSYLAQGRFLVKLIGNKFVIASNRITTRAKAEVRFIKSILNMKKYEYLKNHILSCFMK